MKAIALIFFGLVVLGAGVGLYFYLQTPGVEVGIEFVKPEQVAVAEPFILTVSLSNYSDTIVENAKLALVIPDGVSFLGQAPDQRVLEQAVGDLGPGSLNQQTFNLIVLEGAQSLKRLEAKLRYRTSGGSTAEFESIEQVDVAVGQPAASFAFTVPEKVFSGENFDLVLDYANNSGEDLKNVRLALEYPPSFTFKKSSFAPERSTNQWNLGALAKGDDGSITVSGNIIGPEQSFANFKGTLSADFLGQRYTLNVQSASVALATSPLSLSVLVNGRSDYAARLGDTLQYALFYKNNSGITVENATVRAALVGELFDFASARTEGALYSLTNTFTWNAASAPTLSSIPPGGSGSVLLQIALKDRFPIRRLSDKNYVLKVIAEIESPTLPPGTAAEKTVGAAALETKVAGNLETKARGYFRDAASGFLNGGPYPPKVNQPTQYTIHWTLVNYATDVSGVRLSAFLQSGTKFTGKVAGNVASKPTYNAASGEVRWDVGNIIATKGVIGEPVEAVFQIEHTPAVNQVGQTVALLGETRIEWADAFVEQTFSSVVPPVTTDLPDDKTITQSERRVQP
jgi:hypothetical protein